MYYSAHFGNWKYQRPFFASKNIICYFYDSAMVKWTQQRKSQIARLQREVLSNSTWPIVYLYIIFFLYYLCYSRLSLATTPPYHFPLNNLLPCQLIANNLITGLNEIQFYLLNFFFSTTCVNLCRQVYIVMSINNNWLLKGGGLGNLALSKR